MGRSVAAPATLCILGLIVIGFLVSFATNGQSGFEELAFNSSDVLGKVWTFVTYPFAYPPQAFIAVLFLCLWLFGIGSIIERDLSIWRYVIFWLLMTAAGAGMLWVGSVLTGVYAPLHGAFIPIAALTVAWGTRYPEQPVTFMFILPLAAKWLAWISAALVFFGTVVQLAPFTALPLVLAWAFASDRLPGIPYSPRSRGASYESKRQKKAHRDFADRVKNREKEREERERLRRMFESSLHEDDKQ